MGVPIKELGTPIRTLSPMEFDARILHGGKLPCRRSSLARSLWEPPAEHFSRRY